MIYVRVLALILSLLLPAIAAESAESQDDQAALIAKARAMLSADKPLAGIVAAFPDSPEKAFLAAVSARSAEDIAAYIRTQPHGAFADMAENQLVRAIADRPTEAGVALYLQLYPDGRAGKSLQRDLLKWQVRRGLKHLQAMKRAHGHDPAFKRIYICAATAYEEEDYTAAKACLDAWDG